MLQSGEEDALPHIRLKEEILFFIGEVEGLLQFVYGRWRLLEKNLDRGVGDDRQSVRRLQEVADVLSDSGYTEDNTFFRASRDP
jgi:hypothetical protein